jgi:hypothetical protein
MGQEVGVSHVLVSQSYSVLQEQALEVALSAIGPRLAPKRCPLLPTDVQQLVPQGGTMRQWACQQWACQQWAFPQWTFEAVLLTWYDLLYLMM